MAESSSEASSASVGVVTINLDIKFIRGFFSTLQKMKTEERLTDFVLKVGGEGGTHIPCHKLVLAVHSEFVSSYFEDTRVTGVTLETLQPAAVERVVRYCYNGTLEMNLEEAKGVLEAAEQLKVPRLKYLIAEQVKGQLTVQNCLGWYFIAGKCKTPDISHRAVEIMCSNIKTIMETPEFLALSYEHLAEYLEFIVRIDRSLALIAAASWVVDDIPGRQSTFIDLLQLVDVTRCTAAALKYIITEYGLYLLTSAPLKQFFMDAILLKVPDWKDSDPGYDIIILGGEFGKPINRQIWTLNLNNGEVVERTNYRRDSFYGAFYFPAVCDSSDAVLFAGGTDKSHERSWLPGSMQSNAKPYCVLYLKSKDLCRPLPELPRRVMGASAVCVGDTRLFVLGSGCRERNRNMYCLDLTTNTWTICAQMPHGEAMPIVAALQDCIYVVTSDQLRRTRLNLPLILQRFDVNSGKWELKTNLPVSVKTTRGACAVAAGPHMYVVGGADDLCLRYSTEDDSWTELATPHDRHLFGAATYVNGKIILCGGRNLKDELSDRVESYDPSRNKWYMLPLRLPRPIWLHHITRR